MCDYFGVNHCQGRRRRGSCNVRTDLTSKKRPNPSFESPNPENYRDSEMETASACSGYCQCRLHIQFPPNCSFPIAQALMGILVDCSIQDGVKCAEQTELLGDAPTVSSEVRLCYSLPTVSCQPFGSAGFDTHCLWNLLNSSDEIDTFSDSFTATAQNRRHLLSVQKIPTNNMRRLEDQVSYNIHVRRAALRGRGFDIISQLYPLESHSVRSAGTHCLWDLSSSGGVDTFSNSPTAIAQNHEQVSVQKIPLDDVQRLKNKHNQNLRFDHGANVNTSHGSRKIWRPWTDESYSPSIKRSAEGNSLFIENNQSAMDLKVHEESADLQPPRGVLAIGLGK
ncbi:unnamed protein product [Thelazia callipaeda]|uniref:Uncharacterized protein n=1 Tax=Thelazia callipaeda TaxID=103827 RepID=A0A0N5D0S9_THECL|nr:unnamed protein product [Thelazia callipaeda]